MSTFTYIKTKIRDRSTMYRVLSSIPGATVEPDAVIPIKGGGSDRVAFRVLVSDEAINAQSFFSSLFRGGVREFWVHEMDDGTMIIEISHDVGAQAKVKRAVSEALGREQQQQHSEVARQDELRRQQQAQQAQQEKQRREAAERERQERLRQQQQAEKKRLADQARQKAEAETRQRREEEQRAEDARLEKERHEQLERERAHAQEKAASILEGLKNRFGGASPSAPGNQTDLQQRASDILQRMTPSSGPSPEGAEPPSDPGAAIDEGMLEDLNQAIAQEYSRQLVMEKLEEVKQTYGINLKEINQLEDGSVEIRLYG